jgi:hypothetical protein
MGVMGAHMAMGIPQALAEGDSSRRFIFIFAQGGWDPTRVFSDQFGNNMVSTEWSAERQSIGSLDFVSHPERPSVDQFFQNYHSKSLICNGVQVRSIAHEICTRIAFTGGTSGEGADWATILGSNQSTEFAVPHMVLGGPSFSGEFAANTVQTGSNAQLDELLSGTITQRNTNPLPQLSDPAEQLVDAYLQQRFRARASQGAYGVDEKLSEKLFASAEAAHALKEQRYSMSFASGVGLGQQIDLSIEALSRGVTRCVSMVHRGNDGLGWDSHADNDATQSTLFESLFGNITRLMTQLHSTRDHNDRPLSETTTLMVFSEMGRTAQLNATIGKDHWPYTSVLLWGEGLSGEGVLGGFDDLYQGLPIEPTTGEYSQTAPVLSIESIGAALLVHGGADPYAHFSDIEPMLGILE